MGALYRLLAYRYVSQRRSRALLIIASVAIGVSTLVSSRLLNHAIATAASETATPLGVGDFYVRNGGNGVDRIIADELRAAAIPGVESVRPLIVDRVRLPGLDNRSSIVIGVELSMELLKPGEENPLKVAFTKTFEENFTTLRLAVSRRLVVLSKPLYDEWVARRKTATDPFTVRYGSEEVECLPIGFIEYEAGSPLATLGLNVVGMELGQAAKLIRPGPSFAAAAVAGPCASESVFYQLFPARIHRIDIMLEPNADRERVRAEVERIVRSRAEVRTPETQNVASRDIVGGIQIGFALCSAGAMIVGLFLVYNALSVTVDERAHDIGIMRSLGATRRQVVLVFLSVAVILGVIGALSGVPIGVLMARGVIWQFRDQLGAMFMNPDADTVLPTVETILFAIGAGVATTLLAALIPSLQAAYRDPAEAVRRVPGGSRGVWRTLHYLTCASLILGGVALVLVRHELPHRIGSFGGMMSTLVGLLLAAPIFTGAMVRLTQPFIRRFLPIEVRIAADNLIRSPGRTGVVIGALAAGVGVMIQTAGVGRSNSVPVNDWLDDVLLADLYVSTGNMNEITSSQSPMAMHIPGKLSTLPGLAGITTLRYNLIEYNGTFIFLTAIDADAYAARAALRTKKDIGLSKLRLLTRDDSVLISENFARKHNVHPGEILELPGPHGKVHVRVADTIRDYSWNRGTIYMDRARYAKLFDDQLVDVCHVYLSDGDATFKTRQTSPRDTEGGRAVAVFASDNGLQVQDRDFVRKFVAELIDRIFLIAFLQQIIVGIVAALGVVTALLISVLQRKRELGLLLAIGATPRQVIFSVIAEAVLMGMFGTLLGLIVGVPLEWYVLRVVLVEESGFVFDLLVPWRQGLGIALGTLTVATLAGLLPALHAVRIEITEAIAYE